MEGLGFENLKNVHLEKISYHEKSTIKFCIG
jgi:hypothetical protein